MILLEDQSRQNRSTAGQWEAFASHRAALERLIVPDRAGLTICVLGAGNCNDVDLGYLVSAYSQVHLVDLDAEALAGAAARQGVAGQERLHVHAPVDLAGTGPLLAGGRSPEELYRHTQAALAHPGPEGLGRFDVVVSPCVLSQLIEPVRQAIGGDFLRYREAVIAIRGAHLRMMARLLRGGGRGVLGVDLVSSENAPGLERAREEELEDLMRDVLGRGRHFTGLDPGSVVEAVRGTRGLGSVAVTRPWVWHLGIRKSMLVYATTFVANGDREAGPVLRLEFGAF